jgi:hypothetical protein
VARTALHAGFETAVGPVTGGRAAAESVVAAETLGRSVLSHPGGAVMALFGEARGHPAAPALLNALAETLGRQG